MTAVVFRMKVCVSEKSGNSIERRDGYRTGALACWLVTLLAWHSTALAWNDAGHMQAALMVYERLDGVAREHLTGVLRAHPRFDEDLMVNIPRGADRAAWSFAAAAVWPDRVRRFEHVRGAAARERLVDRYHQPRWHYINLPTFLTAADRSALTPVAVNTALTPRGSEMAAFNIVQAIVYLESTWITAAAADRAVALCWLLHLYADLHQPLHATALFAEKLFPDGDRGGNEIEVGPRLNLHGYWDALLGTDRRWRSIQHLVAARVTVGPAHADEPSNWASQSRLLAERVVYDDEVRRQLAAGSTRVRLSDDYAEKAAGLAERQLELAVLRSVDRLTRLAGSASVR